VTEESLVQPQFQETLMTIEHKQAIPNRLSWLSLFAIILVAFTTYASSLNSGFIWDDWDFVKFLIRLPFPAYMAQYFDPRLQFMWYRPMSGVLWWMNYQLFGVNPIGYHLVALVIHTANCLLLFALVRRVSANFRPGLIAALIYSGLPLFTDAILWLADPQILATLWYLLAIWFWLTFLGTKSRIGWFLALGFAFLALITKETSITLPITLLLVDRLLVREPATWQTLFRRYLPFALLELFYLAMMYRALTVGVFPNQIGYAPGVHIGIHALQFLQRMVFPWSSDLVFSIVAFGGGVLILRWANRDKDFRSQIAFLGLTTLLLILPTSALTEPGVKTRYAYTAAMLIAILYALGIETLARIPGRKWITWILAFVLSFIVLWNGTGANQSSQAWAEMSREQRLPFRKIAQEHPQFPEDTYLYFINQWVEHIRGMFLARYGLGLTVQDSYSDQKAGLQYHQNSIVIYYDNQDNPIELPVNKKTFAQATFSPPREFDASIQTLGYELVSSRVRRGEHLALLIYWRGMKKLDKDYTIFAHLVDANGNTVVASDSQPRGGANPTTRWEPNTMVTDGIVMPIDEEVPLGDTYHLEIGLYYLPTMQRLYLADGSASIVIGPIEIVP
jgi:hypothetical protein